MCFYHTIHYTPLPTVINDNPLGISQNLFSFLVSVINGFVFQLYRFEAYGLISERGVASHREQL